MCCASPHFLRKAGTFARKRHHHLDHLSSSKSNKSKSVRVKKVTSPKSYAPRMTVVLVSRGPDNEMYPLTLKGYHHDEDPHNSFSMSTMMLATNVAGGGGATATTAADPVDDNDDITAQSFPLSSFPIIEWPNDNENEKEVGPDESMLLSFLPCSISPIFSSSDCHRGLLRCKSFGSQLNFMATA